MFGFITWTWKLSTPQILFCLITDSHAMLWAVIWVNGIIPTKSKHMFSCVFTVCYSSQGSKLGKKTLKKLDARGRLFVVYILTWLYDSKDTQEKTVTLTWRWNKSSMWSRGWESPGLLTYHNFPLKLTPKIYPWECADLQWNIHENN